MQESERRIKNALKAMKKRIEREKKQAILEDSNFKGKEQRKPDSLAYIRLLIARHPGVFFTFSTKLFLQTARTFISIRKVPLFV